MNATFANYASEWQWPFKITGSFRESALLVVYFSMFIPTGVQAQAPSSVVGNTIGISITSGTYPFASYGYCLLLPASSGNGYQTIGIYNVADSSGTYSYSSAGAIASIDMDDSIGGAIVGSLDFTTPSYGSYTVTNATYSAYQNGNFEFYSGQVPDSIAGETVECAVQNGLSPLANAGTFTFKPAASGDTYVIVGDKVNTANSSGTYSYSKLNSTTALLQLVDRKVGVENAYISVNPANTMFSLSTTGEFAAQTVEGGAYQIGSFIMADSSPFLPVKGLYNGLFFTSNGITGATAGMLKGLNVNQKGAYSGTLLIDGSSRSISGIFNLAGQATNIVRLSGNQGDIIVAMALGTSTNAAPQVTGTVAGTANGVSWTANLVADFAAGTYPQSEFTMLIPPDTNNASPTNSPGGDGYALIACNAGTARMTGALADGTVFSQTVPVSQDGSVPVYANLYGGKGLLLGWINLDVTNTTNVGLTWIHPARASGLYQGGFVNVLLSNQIPLSAWTNPPANLGLITNLSMVEAINNTNTLLNIPVTANIVGSVAKVTGPSLTGSINLKTGMFKATIGNGSSKITGYGAILLNDLTNSGGYFLTKTNAQAVQLTP